MVNRRRVIIRPVLDKLAVFVHYRHMHDSPNMADRRVAKTIAALRLALVEIILEKHYDDITVQDIIDRANVGRSTFYTHFRDKEDLLVGDWKKFLDLLAMHIDLKAPSGRIAPVEGLMMHLKDYHAFYRALVKSGKTDRLFALGIEHLANKIEAKIVATKISRLSVPAPIVAHYLALQIFGTLRWWLDNNMVQTPAEMDCFFHELVAPGIRNVINVASGSAATTTAAN